MIISLICAFVLILILICINLYAIRKIRQLEQLTEIDEDDLDKLAHECADKIIDTTKDFPFPKDVEESVWFGIIDGYKEGYHKVIEKLVELTTTKIVKK